MSLRTVMSFFVKFLPSSSEKLGGILTTCFIVVVPCECLVYVSLGVVPLLGSGTGVASDLVQDRSLLPGLDGFFVD